MGRQKKNNSGITLVALVISIIVMLILAGVSLNATIGENGIVTRAQEAALQHRIATELENLNLELAKSNIEVVSDDEEVSISNLVNDLITKGIVDGYVKNADDNMIVGIDRETKNKYFFLTKGENTYKVLQGIDGIFKAEVASLVSGGDISGGYALITASSFNNDTSLPEAEKGKFTILNDSNVIFMDTVSGELSIYVKSGVHANVEIYATMNLTNTNIQRSAIELESGATLDLYVNSGVEVTVNSGVATIAELGEPGKGGYAGIRVPEGATLNLSGEGTIKAYGGDGSKGSDVTWTRETEPHWSQKIGAGGGGAGAGIGGKGGNGGRGSSPTGQDGFPGENAGSINLHDNIKVYAYGGAGGSAGKSTANASGTGGGGYPAAGIGGGGAGGGSGTCCTASGGYTGGVDNTYGTGGKNGLAYHGGGYYTGYSGYTSYGLDDNILGGLGKVGNYSSAVVPRNDYQVHDGGNGGNGGEGAILKKSNTSIIQAYNGNIFTDGTSYNNGENQSYIYAQNGIATKKAIFPKTMKSNHQATPPTYIDAHSIDTLEKYNSGLTTKSYKLSSSLPDFTFDMSKQGIGSGAGYIETSNGSYEIYNEDSNGNFTTVYAGT